VRSALAFPDPAKIEGGKNRAGAQRGTALLRGVLTHDGGLSGGLVDGCCRGLSEFEGKRAISKVVCAPVGASGSACWISALTEFALLDGNIDPHFLSIHRR
jgi:hypothetical protein